MANLEGDLMSRQARAPQSKPGRAHTVSRLKGADADLYMKQQLGGRSKDKRRQPGATRSRVKWLKLDAMRYKIGTAEWRGSRGPTTAGARER
eukprot:15447827-Alexandrium_andersonii.AAC.1